MNEEVKEEIEALMSIYEDDMEGKFIIPVFKQKVQAKKSREIK